VKTTLTHELEGLKWQSRPDCLVGLLIDRTVQCERWRVCKGAVIVGKITPVCVHSLGRQFTAFIIFTKGSVTTKILRALHGGQVP
jgi:hypothetical protein